MVEIGAKEVMDAEEEKEVEQRMGGRESKPSTLSSRKEATTSKAVNDVKSTEARGVQ